jgi:LacI family transcriptional regulator
MQRPTGSKKKKNYKVRPQVMQPKKATIHDVAREAGVSIFAVSRTLNGKSGVNSETRDLVLKVSRRLGMRPRPVAQRRHFALIIPDRGGFLPGGYVSNVTFELLHEVSAQGMGLSLFNDSDFPKLARQVFDGIFALTWQPQVIEQLAQITDTPVVVVNRFSLADRYHVVGWDHRAEGRTVGEYLVRRGHRRPGFIAASPLARHSSRSRLEGFREVFAASGLPVDPQLAEALETPEQLVSALRRLIDRRVDSIYFPGQERLGIEAVRLLQRVFQLRVPDDISIVAGENAGWSALCDPPLTTVDAPLELLARRCVDHMVNLMEHLPTEPTEVLIATPIIERLTVVDRSPAHGSVSTA